VINRYLCLITQIEYTNTLSETPSSEARFSTQKFWEFPPLLSPTFELLTLLRRPCVYFQRTCLRNGLSMDTNFSVTIETKTVWWNFRKLFRKRFYQQIVKVRTTFFKPEATWNVIAMSLGFCHLCVLVKARQRLRAYWQENRKLAKDRDLRMRLWLFICQEIEEEDMVW